MNSLYFKQSYKNINVINGLKFRGFSSILCKIPWLFQYVQIPLDVGTMKSLPGIAVTPHKLFSCYKVKLTIIPLHVFKISLSADVLHQIFSVLIIIVPFFYVFFVWLRQFEALQNRHIVYLVLFQVKSWSSKEFKNDELSMY